MKVFEIMTYTCALVAILILYAIFTSAQSAIQEATGIALAAAVVVIPYCIHGAMYRARMALEIERLRSARQTTDRENETAVSDD